MPAIGPNMPRWLKRYLAVTGVNFIPMPYNSVAPSMGPIVSVMNSQGGENSSREADQLTKLCNGTVYV